MKAKAIDKEQRDFLVGIGNDALFIANEMKDYAKVCKAADDADKVRDDFFLEKLRVPEFANRVDRVRDWAGAKRNGDILVVNGHTYTSVKPLFKQEWGVSYEHVRKCCLKLDRLRGLVDGECDTTTAAPPSPTTPPHPAAPPTAAPRTAAPPTAAPTDTTPPFEVLSVNGRDPKFTVAKRVESAFDFAVSLTDGLTTAEKYEFYMGMIEKSQDEADLAEEAMDENEETK
jgi:hypothetical protein